MTNKNDDYDDDEGTAAVIKSRAVAYVHTIYMPIQVSHDDSLSELCNKLRSFDEKDAVIMYLKNYGGSCHAGQCIINAMADCLAKITVVVEAPCYSMGALIAISGESLVMHQGTFLMFHNYSTMARGKGGEFIEQIKQHDIWLKEQQHNTCFPFLTRAEIKKLEHDQDIYIAHNDPTLNVRLDRHFKHQSKSRRRIHVGI